MIRILSLTGLIVFCVNLTRAQTQYEVSAIPSAIRKDADAVVRNEEYILTVRSQSHATLSYKSAVTILSKSGENHANIMEYYDKLSSIHNLRAALYDGNGNKIKSYKPSDFKDESITSYGTLYDDSRVKRLNFMHDNFPYTVEYSYEKDYNGYLSFPSWTPVTAFDCGVEKSIFKVQIPKYLSIKRLTANNLKTDSTLSDNKINYSWSCSLIPPISYEPMSTGLREITPWVQISPNTFEYDHSHGSVENWQNLGSWIYKSNLNAQVLPEAIKSKIRGLVGNAKTDKEKIALLYQYLQSNTRYVSVQLGIGGFIPIGAEKVANVNYGDCKALSNYMKALLLAAGIDSHLVVIGADMPSLHPDYASFGQANHMILCVPSVSDTTWLECTSQHTPMGFLGKSTSSKRALLVTEDGGKLAYTPSYEPDDNFQHRLADVKLSADGTAEINIKTDYGYCQFEDQLEKLFIEPTELRKQLQQSLQIPNVEIINVDVKQSDRNVPGLTEQLSLNGSDLLSRGGDKLFLMLNMLGRRESVPRKIVARKTSFAVSYGFKDSDIFTYKLPDGYSVEFLPKDVTIETEFGKYTANARLKGNTIIYTRTQLMKSKTYPAVRYNDLVEFYKKIYMSDKQKAVLAKAN